MENVVFVKDISKEEPSKIEDLCFVKSSNERPVIMLQQ